MEGQMQSCPSLIQSRQIPPQAPRVSLASLFRTQHQPYPWLSQLLSLLVGVLLLRLVASAGAAPLPASRQNPPFRTPTGVAFVILFASSPAQGGSGLFSHCAVHFTVLVVILQLYRYWLIAHPWG